MCMLACLQANAIFSALNPVMALWIGKTAGKALEEVEKTAAEAAGKVGTVAVSVHACSCTFQHSVSACRAC